MSPAGERNRKKKKGDYVKKKKKKRQSSAFGDRQLTAGHIHSDSRQNRAVQSQCTVHICKQTAASKHTRARTDTHKAVVQWSCWDMSDDIESGSKTAAAVEVSLWSETHAAGRELQMKTV